MQLVGLRSRNISASTWRSEQQKRTRRFGAWLYEATLTNQTWLSTFTTSPPAALAAPLQTMAPTCANSACLGGVRACRARVFDLAHATAGQKNPFASCLPTDPSDACPPNSLPQETPMWRRGWTPKGTDKAATLCNACGILYAPRPPSPHAPRFFFSKEVLPKSLETFPPTKFRLVCSNFCLEKN